MKPQTIRLITGKTFVRCLAMSLVGLLPLLDAQAQSAPSCLRYDQVQQRLIHNAYSNAFAPKDEQLLDQLIHHRIRAVELDLMPRGYPCYTSDPPEGGEPDWYIYHDCGEGQIRTTINTLGDALRLFKAFHDAQPQHEVVTVYLEFSSNEASKGGRSEFGNYSPDQLDELIRKRLGDALFTPASLLAWGGERPDATGSLHRVVSTRGWPTTDDLRGKFIFIVHGEGDDKNQYFGTPEPNLDEMYNRAAFYLDNGEVWKSPEFISNPAPWAIFHSEPNAEETAWLRRDFPGHVLRPSAANNADRVMARQLAGIQLINTDTMDAEEHEFIRFYNDRLYPFGASVPKADGTYPAGAEAWTHPAVVGKAEPGSIFILGDKSGGDIGGDHDDFIFAPLRIPPSNQPEVWTAEIASASNRRVYEGGRGLLMARASEAPDAPYCAVGRAADDLGLLAQYRSDYGLGTAITFLDPFSSLFVTGRFTENNHFVMLVLLPYDGGGSTFCQTFGSRDGQSWRPIGDVIDFPGIRLTQVGLAVTAGQSTPPPHYTKIDFVNLRRSVSWLPSEAIDLDLFGLVRIGDAEEPFVQKISQAAITCADLGAENEPGVCGAHVDLDGAIGGHCGTTQFNTAPDQLFPVGVTRIQAATPGAATCAFNVTVRDTQKPVLDAAVTTPVLSRADRELVNVGLMASATDNCSAVSAVEVAVYSDESDTEADSRFSPDAKDIGLGTLRLREERNARGDGRVYLILLKVTDTAGNSVFTSRAVVVPSDQSQAALDAVNAQAAAARAYADANGAPPPGFIAVGSGPVLGPKQ